MHSRIFQLATSEIEPDDYLSELDFDSEDYFVGPIADYVSSDCDRKEDIRFLLELYKEHGIQYEEDEQGNSYLVFSDSFKKNYFENRFNKIANDLSNMTLEQFASDYSTVYKISNAIEDKFGFYVYFDHPETFDSFVRCLTPGTRYYIGGTVDYHY